MFRDAKRRKASGWAKWREAREAALRGEVGGPAIPAAARPPDGFHITRNAGSYDAEGNLLRQWIGTKPAPGEEFAVPAGHVVRGQSALVSADGRVMQKWVKTHETRRTHTLIETLHATLAKYRGKAPPVSPPLETDADTMMLYLLPDLHLGMYAWAQETGAHYDTRQAVNIALAHIQVLVEQARPSQQATLVILGDFFHANDHKGVTPGSGHQLDIDGRWPRVYEIGSRLVMSLVHLLLAKHEKLELVILPGNHDPDAATCLMVAMQLYFESNPRVAVTPIPGVVWYRRFGKCLIGATHGHTMKPDRMAMAMAEDRKEDWGGTDHRHLFFGHIHHETVREVGAVRCESLHSPASRDAWNHNSGYRSGRSLTAVVFHAEDGEIGRHRVVVRPHRLQPGAKQGA
jgi:hypothetical protein